MPSRPTARFDALALRSSKVSLTKLQQYIQTENAAAGTRGTGKKKILGKLVIIHCAKKNSERIKKGKKLKAMNTIQAPFAN